MARRVASYDWANTPVGPMADWPSSLRLAVDICLSSRFPMFVWWGPSLINIYNDAYAPVLGKRHPDALGQPASQTWGDIWDTVGVQAHAVMSRGEATWNERVLLVMERHGYPEETYFTWSYSPIRDEAGQIAGVFCACTEDTKSVLAERERDRQVEQRRQADERARTILESITDAFFALNRNWQFTYANPQGEQLLGRTPGELNGRVIWDEYPGIIGTEFETMYRRAMEYGERGSATLYYADHDRWYEAHTYPSPEGLSVFFRDVSEGKRADEKLRSSEQRLNAIVQTALDCIVGMDLQGRITEWNPAAESTFGYRRDEAIGQNMAELIIPLTYRERHRAGLAKYVATGDGSILGKRLELSARRKDGTEFPIELTITPLSGEDSQAFTGYLRDITERNRTTERIRSLHQIAAALSDAVTPDDVARVAVQQGIAAVGATAGSLVLLDTDGVHLQMVGSVGYPADVIQNWQRFRIDAPIPLAEAVRTGDAVYTESPEDRLKRYPALAPVNAVAATRSSACLPLTIGGRTTGALGLSFDRTAAFSAEDKAFLLSLSRQCAHALERARLYEGERQLRTEAERASRMKDEFLATLSHELRTPLNAILGWSQIMRAAPDADDVAQGLEVIERNARAQAQIIEDLLDMSRIVSGKIRLDLQRIDLPSIVREAADTARPTALAKSIQLNVVIDPLTGLNVLGDANRLQQILWNLLSNAFKFTPIGGQVDLRLVRAGSHLEMSVSDTGQGIDPDFLPHVFDRFRQADASTTRRHGGLGIGLSIVKQLAELHGGTISVSSDGPGRGAAFVVVLPFGGGPADSQPDVRPASLNAMPATNLSVSPTPSVRGLRVLIVDDEADARALVQRLLEANQAIVVSAASADEALGLLGSQRFDVLVSDIGMPGQDGYAFIRRVRAMGASNGGDLPAIALTAYARAEDRIKAIAAGFQMHVAKPIDRIEILTVVAAAAGRVGPPGAIV